MSKKLFSGPLLFIILGGLVVLAYRYLPFESLLEKVKAGRGDAQTIEQAAPPVAEQGPVDSTPAPVAPAAPEETEHSLADAEPPPAESESAPPLPGSAAESATAATVPPVPTASPQPQVVAVPEVSSPPPPVVLQAEVSPLEKTAPRVAVPTEVRVPKSTPRQEPVVPAGEPPTTVAAAGKPEPIPEPVLPNLRVFVQADVHERAGLGDLGADSYAEQLKVELTAVAGDYLGREAVQREDPNMKFRDYLAEGREGLEQICMPAQAQRVLLADVEISAAGFSNVDSAYWPEVSYIAINCGDGRVHKSPRKRLEPHRLDTFEFQQQFSRRSQEFIVSQGYFLKP